MSEESFVAFSPRPRAAVDPAGVRRRLAMEPSFVRFRLFIAAADTGEMPLHKAFCASSLTEAAKNGKNGRNGETRDDGVRSRYQRDMLTA